MAKQTLILNIVIYSVVPSPYQRDLFAALAQQTELNVRVYYLEPESPDSPWPHRPLQSYESILSGFWLAWGTSRVHINYHWPRFKATKHPVDLVILNGYQSLTAQLVVHLQARNVPCIFWGEKMVAASTGLKGMLQRYLAQGLQNCAAIAAIGSQAVSTYQQRFPHKPIFNIPYYCDLSQFQTTIPQRPRPCPTLLLCGQMIARKGVDTLLAAFEQLLGQGYLAKLLLVGRQAELPEMLSVMRPQTLQAIEYAGFQPPDQLHHFFQRADIFVLPSRYDGWGVVVNQALGAGLPLICSDAVGSGPDLIQPGLNGAIFPAGDVTALTQALKTYLDEPAELTAASQCSRKLASSWSPNAGAERWLAAIHTVLHSTQILQRC